MWQPWKTDHEIPDFYEVSIEFLNGKSRKIQLVEQQVKDNYISMLTHDNKYIMLPLVNIVSIDFSDDYTKLIELQAKKAQKDAV